MMSIQASSGRNSPSPDSSICVAGKYSATYAFAGGLHLAAGPPAPVEFTNFTKAAHIGFVHYKGSRGCVHDTRRGRTRASASRTSTATGGRTSTSLTGAIPIDRGITARNALYRNNGDGTFTDVTDKAGVPGNAYGLGCVWGDYDNDGFPDLYVTQYGKDILYHNNGDGTFTDVTDKAGVGGMDFGTMFHTGATFFDYDRDGRLDLYVGGYANFGPKSQRYCNIGAGMPSSCRPMVYGGSPDVLYHNNGDGTFTNVTRKAGVYQPKGLNLSVGAADYDNDGWPDLFVANDGLEAYLYHNQHDGTFKEIAVPSGMALTGDGGTMAAMCISLGDYDNDGYLDLYISDFQLASDHVWHNDRKGFFEEASQTVGITAPTKHVLSFGGGFFDMDNDGWLDLFIANGHVYEGVEKVFPDTTYKQINSLFHNNGAGKFVEVTRQAGNGFAVPYAARGAAFGDFDNNGNLDVIVANNGDAPLLLHNGGGTGNHFVNFKLIGRKSNRDAMGARLRLRAGGVSQIREIAGGGSYLSQSDLRAHFGLGRAQKADSLEVFWPSGLHQMFRDIAADGFYVIDEGSDQLGKQKSTRKPPPI